MTIKTNILEKRKKLENDFLYKINLLKYKKWVNTFLIRKGNKKLLQSKILKVTKESNLKKNFFPISLMKIFDMYEQPIQLKEKIISKKKKFNFFQLHKQNQNERHFFKLLKVTLTKKQKLKFNDKFLPNFIHLSSKQQDSWDSNKKYFQNLSELWESTYNTTIKKEEEDVGLEDKFYNKKEPMIKTFQIKISTHDSYYLNVFLNDLKAWIFSLFSKDSLKFSIIHLPSRSKKLTILKSPHVNKKARNQYEMNTYSKILIFEYSIHINQIEFFKYLYLFMSKYPNLKFHFTIKKNP